MSVPRHALLAFAVAAAASLSAGSPARAATATTPGKVVLQPSDAAGNEVSGPGYYQVNATPGATSTQYALVGNVGKKPVTVSIAPVDARSGVYGGVSYGLPQQKLKQVGSWIHLSYGKVLVHPGRAAVVPFTLSVPKNAKPGQYVGGLTAFVPAHAGRDTGPKRQRDGSIILQLRRVVAVVVTVPGAAYGRFTVARTNPKQRPDAVYLIAHIRNTGTTLLSGQGHLWMWKLGVKQTVLSRPLTVDTTVPRTTVLYPVLWSKHPAKGTYHVTVAMNWGPHGKTVRQSTFVWPLPAKKH